MKKMMTLVLTMGLVGVTTAVMAFGVPNISGTRTEAVAKKVAGNVVKSAVKDDVNKYLAGNSCQCNAKTGEISNCNPSAIGSYVGGRSDALKTFFGRHLRFHATAANRVCAWKIRDVVQPRYSYWSYYWTQDKSLGKRIKMWVD